MTTKHCDYCVPHEETKPSEFFKFPTGEAHVKLTEFHEVLHVPMMPNLNDWIMTILLASDANHRLGDGKPFDLFIPYLPYSRQDRPTGENEPFSLKVLADLLKTTKARKIITLDVHSDSAFSCIDSLVNIPVTFWEPFIAGKTLVIPDQGAFKKLSKLAIKDSVICVKKRDEATGHLKIEHIVGEVEGKQCVIVDDICDGGMTFILLAKELLARGAKSVDLVVSHGVFTKGIEVLFEAGISNIATTDSFPQKPHPNLQVVPLTLYKV